MAPDPQPREAAAIAGLLGRFLPVMSGHWGGWLIGSFPVFLEIRLVDGDTAEVHYRIGYGGATVRMRRKEGVWKQVDIISRWTE